MKKNKVNVPVPAGLNDRQIKIAQACAKAQIEGTTIDNLCKELSISSRTLYAGEYKGNPVFDNYVSELVEAAIPDDVFEAWDNVKGHILKLTDQKEMTEKQISLFMTTFPHVVKLDAEKQMKKHGLEETPVSKTKTSTSGFVSPAERMNSLLERLRK